MGRWQTCYVCGGYSRGVRHRACRPAYKRRRYLICEGCGKPSRGAMHRRCRYPNAGRLCGYCKEPMEREGRHHQRCQPSKVALAIFLDMPRVLQRQCSKCSEWWPFLGYDGDVDPGENWTLAYNRDRLIYLSVCRACDVQRERERVEAKAA